MSVEKNSLRGILSSGKKTCGAWVVSGSNTVAEAMALAGFDWLLIDCEHTAVDFQTLLSQLQAVKTTDTMPIVRVPSNNAATIKRVLDIGAEGVMVPAINNGKEAAQAVAACRYPPEGKRGVASTITRVAHYGLDQGNYIKNANDRIAVILQVETVEAVENIDEILSVNGVDSIFIGSTDLSADMGFVGEKEHPKVKEAIETVEASAKKAKVPLGAAASSWEKARTYYKKGYSMVSLCAEMVLLARTTEALTSKFREEYGD